MQDGNSVAALAAYFSVYQYVPFRRLKTLFTKVFKLPSSAGTLVNLLEKAAVKSDFFYAKIKAEIEVSKVVGSDKTSAKVNGKKWWIGVWQNFTRTMRRQGRNYHVSASADPPHRRTCPLQVIEGAGSTSGGIP